MRKIFIPILMASAVLPSAALAQDRERFADRRAEQAEQRSEQREERAQQRQERQVVRAERQADRPEPRAPEFRRQRPASDQGAEQRSDVARERAFGERGREMRSDRANEVLGDGERRQWGDRGDTNDQRAVDRRGRPTLPAVDGTPRPAPEAQTGRSGGFDELRGRVIRDGRRVEDRRHDRDGDWQRDSRHRDWRRDWRYDNRYDWRRHRDRNRWVFRIGTYYDPYRYGYRRFNIGYNLWPSYYSSRYWLNDPWQYRLPPAYGPYRWVRYYDDALLVNIYTGQVVDVIYSFFW